MWRLIKRVRADLRENKIVSLFVIFVMYSCLAVFYYNYFTAKSKQNDDTSYNRYDFASGGVSFEGPAFTKISLSAGKLLLSGFDGSVSVGTLETNDMPSEGWCRTIETKNKPRRDCINLIGTKIIVFSSESPGLFAGLEHMAGSLQKND